jgi:hypothetical protein
MTIFPNTGRRFEMKKLAVLIAIIALVGITWETDSFARMGMKWQGSGGWGMGSAYNRMYDPKTIETIKGEVLSVDQVTPAKGMRAGIHLMVKTDKDTISVHLGPSWYIENQDVKILPKDTLEITGSRITFQGKPALIASEVKKGEEILKLRDENGVPLWSGWRRR